MDKFNLMCYYQNVRGLRTKTATFRRNLLLNNYGVIALTETWLVDSISDSELFDHRYLVWRHDRNYDLTGQSMGGGVLLATYKDLHVSPRPEWSSTAEDIWVTISLGNNKLHVCAVYLCGQNAGLSFSQQLSNFLIQLRDIITTNPSDSYLVMGDFNMSSIQWNLTTTDASSASYLEPIHVFGFNECNFIDELNLVDLHQYNYVTNKFGRLLDLVLSNVDVSVYDIADALVPLDPHHNALGVMMSLCYVKPLKPAPRIKYCYNQGDFDAFNNDLSTIDWETNLSNLALDDAVNFFYATIESFRSKYVPTKHIRKRTYPPWYSSALIKVLKEKYKFISKYKVYGMISDKQSINVLTKRAKLLEAECYRLYITRVESSIKTNPKHFWSYFKSLSKTNALPNTMKYNNSISSSGNEICDLFASYFNSNFLLPDNLPCTDRPGGTSSSTGMPDGDISSISLSMSSIKSILGKLDSSKSAGPDTVPPILLIKCADQLSVPLYILFKRSINEGYMPLAWKRAFISPIHKKGSKNEIVNYRPISKLCIIAKVFERIVYGQLYSALRTSLPVSQHGFVRGRSTVTNLALLNEFVTDSMDGGAQADVVYTDYSKAFDRIDHKMLILKLQMAGIRGDLLRWFTSYIDNRSQAVVLANYTSNWTRVPSGVPQGSLLGPLLFLIFVADIDTCFQNSTLLSFADDMKIFKSIKNEDDAVALQEDLSRLDNYCIKNKLDLNVSKCFIMSFSRKKNLISYNYTLQSQHLKRVSEMRDLGVIHDSKFIFDSHITSIVGKASKSLGFIMRCSKEFKNIKTIKILYSTYVRCHLEYASQIWNPRYAVYIDRIERIQRKLIRFLNFKTYNNEKNYYKSCAHFHFLPLQHRRKVSDVLFLKKIMVSSIDCPNLLSHVNLYAPTRTYRYSSLFYLPSVATNYRQNSVIYRCCNTFNNFMNEINSDLDIFSSGLATFRTKLNNNFFSKYV